jgi:hypothetical protein
MADQNGLVIGDELGRQAADEENHENHERPEAPAVPAKILPPAPVEGR